MKINRDKLVRIRTVKIKNIVLIIIILAIMSLAYPFNAIFVHYSKTYMTENTPVEEYIDISGNNNMRQSFVAMDKKLNKVTIYFDKNKSSYSGTLKITLRDADSVLKKWDIKADNVGRKLSIYPNCILDVNKGYDITISTKNVNNYLAVGANSDGGLEINGNKQNRGLSIDYKYLSEINRMQTLAWWFICVTIFLVVFYMLNVKSPRNILDSLKKKKNLNQVIVIANAVGLFLLQLLYLHTS